MAEYRRAIQVSPGYALNYYAIMWIQRRMGHYSDVLVSMQTSYHLYHTNETEPHMVEEIAGAYAAGGRDGFLKEKSNSRPREHVPPSTWRAITLKKANRISVELFS